WRTPLIMNRVVITGLGVVSPLGVGMEPTWRMLIEGRSGISRIEAFDTTGYRCRIAGQVKGWDPTQFTEHRRLKEMDRFTEVALAHHLRGPSYSIGSGCASGAHSVGEAAEWIKRGRATVMLAGGAEATITPVGIAGFEAMLALSRRNDDPERASRPWDRDRD